MASGSSGVSWSGGDGADGGFAAVPVVAGGHHHGRLVAYSPTGTLRDSDIGILERAATVAALVITKQEAVTAVESKYRADFLRDVLIGRGGPRVPERARAFGWDLERPVTVVVAEMDPDGEERVGPGPAARPPGCRRCGGTTRAARWRASPTRSSRSSGPGWT